MRIAPPLSAAITSALVALVGTAPADAAPRASTCDGSRSTRLVNVTWGAVADDEGTELNDPALKGLGLRYRDKNPKVRTARQGTSLRPEVCAGTRSIALLPALRPGHRVVAASLNGTFVAWRTARNGRSGVVRVGRVLPSGRVASIRNAPTPATPAARAVDERINLATDGTVAWMTYAGTDRAYAWPRGGRPVNLRPATDDPSDTTSGATIAFLDDQRVVIGSSNTPLRYRVARPGRCPTLTTGTWRNLDGWSIARQSGGHETYGGGGSGWDRALVCDPVTGTYLRIFVETSGASSVGGGPYFSSTSVTRFARIGPWLALERLTAGNTSGPNQHNTELTDTRTGETTVLRGALRGPNAPLPTVPDNDVTNRVPWAPIEPAVTIVPGALAWTTPAQDGNIVYLSDAAGSREIGRPTDRDVELNSTTVTWNTGQTRTGVPVVPDPSWKTAVRTAPRPR